MITAEEARSYDKRKYNEERAEKRVIKSIIRASKHHHDSVHYDEYFLFDCNKSLYVADHIEELKQLGYNAYTWTKRLVGSDAIIVHAVVEW